MVQCYICNTEITKANNTLEHIIPNSIGGELKSKDLICRECNSKTGEMIDKNIANAYHLIMIMLDLKKDRGEVAPLKIKKDGILYNLHSDGTIENTDFKKISDNKFIMPLYQKEDFLKKIKKKKGNLKYRQEKKYTLSPSFQIDFGTIDDKLRVSILKIALNFAIYNKIDKKNLKESIAFLKNNTPNNVVPYVDKIEDEINSIYHKIRLFKDGNNLIVTVTLFNIFKFVVFLNKNFDDNLEEMEYILYLKNETKTMYETKKFELNENEQWEIFNNNKESYIKNINALLKFMTDVDKKKFLSKITNKIISNLEQFKNYPFYTYEKYYYFSTKEPITKLLGSTFKNERILNSNG